MRICLLSKFPPIQGGVSARTYWMSRGFAERSIETHVVTNANCVEKEYRINDISSDSPSNLHVHFIDPDLPWHIPDSQLYVPRLLDRTLTLIKESRIDLIDTGYLIPYGILGYLVFKIAGIPYVLRHGGSDLEKFFRKGVLRDLLEQVIKDASAIITDDQNKETFQGLNSKIFTVPRYIPDEKYFKPSLSPHAKPTFAYIGKINYHWRHKSLHRIADIFQDLKDDYRLLFVGQGKGFNDFSEFMAGYGLANTEFRQFVHPANMPRLLNEIDFLIYFNKDNPIKDFTNIFCEALWSGVKILTDDSMDFRLYLDYLELTAEDQIMNLPIDDIGETRFKIMEIMNDWERPQRFINRPLYDFDTYLDINLEVYEQALK